MQVNLAGPYYGTKLRWFVGTNWNVQQHEDGTRQNALDIEYHQQILDDPRNGLNRIIWGRETCPTTGRPHYQMFFEFKSPRSVAPRNLGRIGDMWGTTHVNVEGMEGTLSENEAYCSKEGTLCMVGPPYMGRGARTDLKELVQQVVAGDLSTSDIVLDNPMLFHQYGRTLERAEGIHHRKKFRTEATKAYWIHGPSGSGKSHMAFTRWGLFDHSTHYIKCGEEDFWEDYEGQDVCILNEFRGSTMKFSTLLELADKWPMVVKRKGKAPASFISSVLVVTSIFSPEECYRGMLDRGDSIEQLTRRFEVIELEPRI